MFQRRGTARVRGLVRADPWSCGSCRSQSSARWPSCANRQFSPACRRRTAWHVIHFSESGAGADDTRRHFPGAHRRRSAVRNHGPLGRQPCSSWLALDLALINYFGQGALLLSSTTPNLIRSMRSPLPGGPLLVLLASTAAGGGSAATISGAFSITRQAVQLDTLPRVETRQTSPDERGQFYVPAANWLMCVAVIGFVLAFGSSTRAVPHTARRSSAQW